MSQAFLIFEAVITAERLEKTDFVREYFSRERKNAYGGAATAARALDNFSNAG